MIYQWIPGYILYILYIYTQLYTYLLFVQTHIVLALGVTRLDWQMSGLCRDLLPYDTTMGRLSPTESMVVPADVFKSEGVENQNRRSIGTPMTWPCALNNWRYQLEWGFFSQVWEKAANLAVKNGAAKKRLVDEKFILGVNMGEWRSFLCANGPWPLVSMTAEVTHWHGCQGLQSPHERDQWRQGTQDLGLWAIKV
jgi:hypothetical protein